MTSLQRGMFWIAIAIASSLLAVNASAEFCTDFENYAGAPEGFPLTGQQGWYLPSGVDFQVFTYLTGNPYGIVDNPTGGLFFVAGRGPGDGTNYARAQHDAVFTNAPWEMTFDVCANYNGTPPASNNIGSFSGQTTPVVATGDFIQIYTWVTGQEGVLYNIGFMHYDAAGVQIAAPGTFAGPEWQNLPINYWFRSGMVVDFATNRITQVSLTDVSGGGGTVTFNPTDWYLEGGAAGSTAPMTGFRLFAGAGSTPGCILAFDNLCIRERGATAVESSTWGSIKARFDVPAGGSQKAAPAAAFPAVQ